MKNKIYLSIKNTYYKVGAVITMCFMSLRVFAAIPAAPAVPGANGNDYIALGNGAAHEVLGDVILIIYVGSIIGAIGIILGALGKARKTEEWGPFGKLTAITLTCLVIFLVLLNTAKTALAG